MNKLHLFTDHESSARIDPGAPHFLTILIVVMAAFCLVGNPALAQGDNDAGPGICSRTANAAFEACQHEIRDDYWITIGNCNNLSDAGTQAECKEEAESALKEGNVQCREQREGRLDICEVLGEAAYDPKINPAMFVDPAKIGKTVAPNPYFPLIRGRTWIYKGGTETITVKVTEDIKMILGIRCAVIHDVVQDDGAVIEDTKDWYAQDIYGNVWYCGEIAQGFEDGELVSIDGSWTAGVDYAQPGLIMKAMPAVGDVYRQEFSLGNAEDMAEVLSLIGSARVPAAACNRTCLVTRDFTPLDPDAVEHKYYAPGTGLILEVNPETGERVELVKVKN